MNLQLGSLNADECPARADELDMLLSGRADESAEVAGECFDGPLLMAYRGNRITPEDDFDVQPLRWRGYAITWDGRLDNRKEIVDAAEISRSDKVPDAEIVLKAYHSKGESIFCKLVGEFACSLWCHDLKLLVFVRSTCGTRPLYYTFNRNRLIWCSNFAHLVRVSDVDLTVNDEYLLQYLVTSPDVRHTPLAKVEAFPANRITRFEDGRIVHGPELWNPLHLSPLRYRTDEEYEEHCRQAVTEAVRVRLRSKGPVFSELSGGLDSSTVVLTADQVLRDQNSSPDELQTLSCVYEETKSADERTFIRAIEEKRGIASHLVHEKDQRITLGLDDTPFTGLPHTLNCFPGRYETFSEIMRQSGARVLLTGKGGDHLFWSWSDGALLVADQLFRLNLVGAHRECRAWSRITARPYFELLISRSLPLLMGNWFSKRSQHQELQVPSWVHPKHRATMKAETVDFDGFANWRAIPSRRAQVFFTHAMLRMFSSGFGEDYPQIYLSHPYSHRPLIEFCLSTPVSQFLRKGETRSLMRRAMTNLLPKKTSRRVSKGLVDEAILRALQREWSRLSPAFEWQVCQRGYTLYPQLQDALGRGRLGFNDLTGPLIRLFSLERWLRSLNRVTHQESFLANATLAERSA